MQRSPTANEWQQTPVSNDASEWSESTQQPVQLQSNNPFLKAGQSDPNPWDNSQGQGSSGDDTRDFRAPSFLRSDGSDHSSQNEGFIPMTARLSLLDQQESKPPSTEQRSTTSLQFTDMSKAQQSDQDPVSRASQNSTVAQVPMGIYLADSARDQQTDQRVPAVTVEPSHDDQYSHTRQYDQQLHGGMLGSENRAGTPASASNATTESSHELIDVDSTNEETDAKAIHEPQALPQNVPSSSGLSVPQSGSLIDSATGPAAEQGILKPTPSPSLSEAESRRQKEQRAETYSIRHVNWTDVTGNLRESPVLVQNENGPCPLLALVNALALRAGKGAQPPIVRALQSREQISLGLLIEAMFDELTTCLGPDQQLPDIEALSQFLTMLHTGMNVNPRLTLESDNAVGSFLETDDLRLYGTFGIPLVHGWVATPSSQTHDALAQVAQYHEDIQLLQFRKAELEDRVFGGGTLSFEEERVMSDIQLIQQFVDVDNTTQLSTFGLDRLAEKLAPGSISILFRNDHFSTLYKHPQSHQLFTMVTDAGYSGHAEVVWESLVDVSGSRTGYFSGDFRPVGHSSAEGSGLVGPRTSSGAARSEIPDEPLEASMNPHEQSDADYAYALQLQFDEEQRNHREHNRRASAPAPRWQTDRPGGADGRSPSALNNASNRGTRGSVADRRAQRTGPFGRSRHGNDNPEDGPPPPYEQAADAPAYFPPQERSHFTDFSQEDRYLRNLPGRRAGASVSAIPDRPRDRSSKDCVVM
ncbi:hypothetical protein PHISP_01911 [Aspergillus sp. HF37]|nr:hypothetical protein PHISP_01911 [Aspergillus sp. HF37]